ncbi:hypothetical protein C2U69_19265 [Cupriavidus pinatubonensis]|nr:hypothetical protein C2U69_19265 [Cupriavidus pinatubonensis]
MFLICRPMGSLQKKHSPCMMKVWEGLKDSPVRLISVSLLKAMQARTPSPRATFEAQSPDVA